jgi:glucokinase
MTLALVADIGGTNTRVALADGAVVRQHTLAKFRNQDFTGIDAVLAQYMSQENIAHIGGACVAGAGPVQDGAVLMTNLFDEHGQPWIIDNARVMRATGATQVAILNDLQAQGQALGHIAPQNLRRVIDGPNVPGASMLVVGLGTGVNAAPVHNTPWGRVVPPSECGHVNMPVRGDEDLALARFVEARLAAAGDIPHAGVEEVLAGRGLANLHAFAAATAGKPANLTSAEVLAALDAGDPVAAHAASLYVRTLARMLGDLALIHLPYDGIYLIGGMSRAMTPHFATYGLEQAFREERRVDLLMKDFSVTVVEDDFAALTGCAAYLAKGGRG